MLDGVSIVSNEEVMLGSVGMYVAAIEDSSAGSVVADVIGVVVMSVSSAVSRAELQANRAVQRSPTAIRGIRFMVFMSPASRSSSKVTPATRMSVASARFLNQRAPMERFLGRYTAQLYAILRIMAGVMFAMHGTQKLFAWPGDRRAATAALSIAGGWIEVITGTLIAIGLWAGSAAFLASGTMAVAYFLRHAEDGFFPIVNRGELAVVYCFLFLFMAGYGSGIWSVDQVLRKPRNRATA